MTAFERLTFVATSLFQPLGVKVLSLSFDLSVKIVVEAVPYQHSLNTDSCFAIPDNSCPVCRDLLNSTALEQTFPAVSPRTA